MGKDDYIYLKMDYIKVENRKIKNSQFDGQYSSLKP